MHFCRLKHLLLPAIFILEPRASYAIIATNEIYIIIVKLTYPPLLIITLDWSVIEYRKSGNSKLNLDNSGHSETFIKGLPNVCFNWKLCYIKRNDAHAREIIMSVREEKRVEKRIGWKSAGKRISVR